MKKRRNDFLLIGGVLLIVGICLLTWWLIPKNKGTVAMVYKEGELICELDLSKPQTVTIQGKISEMKIVVSYGKISVVESGCPNQICVNTGKVSMEHETITCLPNEVTIVLVGGEV